MSKSTDIFLRSVTAETERIAYRAPIKFGGRVVTDAVLVHVTADVETRDGRRGRGHGSMPMGNIWAWPTRETAPEATLAAMLDLAMKLAQQAADYTECGHPLDITLDLAAAHAAAADEANRAAGVTEPMPRLGQLVAASPMEAAIHDAHGKTLGLSSFDTLGREFVGRDLAAYLNDDFRGEYLDRYTLRAPKPRIPLYHLVGALDPLFASDIGQPIGDGLPETLGDWIRADGLTHLKIKLNGDDLTWDVERVLTVEAAASEARRVLDNGAKGGGEWHYSLDFNERCADVGYVLEFLACVGERSPAALGRVQYIEQPTHRDLNSHPHHRMHAAAAIKPVVIDESLIDLESLLTARDMGYSGVALKACKGQTEALLMGAAAQKYGMFLCVQDLTCPGASFLHSASLSARIPTVAAIEGNARQYCPAGNAGWRDRYPGMFRVTDGTLATAELAGPGLGF